VPLGAATMLLPGAGPALAGGVPDPGAIAPNQFFMGLVNGQSVAARIKVTCDGPLNLPGVGHPVAGQTVEVVPAAPLPFPVPTTAVGFTGSAGTVIDVGVGVPNKVVPQLRLRLYHTTAQIPTDAVVPCDGAGVATFVPDPTSPTARTATVKIIFVSQPPSPFSGQANAPG
jgi:hypothetical protein